MFVLLLGLIWFFAWLNSTQIKAVEARVEVLEQK